MKKVLFVAKVVRSHIATFHLPYLKMFKEMGWETAVAAHPQHPRHCHRRVGMAPAVETA